jgi:transcriptional regulator with XRE-family HTH domain
VHTKRKGDLMETNTKSRKGRPLGYPEYTEKIVKIIDVFTPSEAAKYIGCTPGAINSWIIGRTNPTKLYLERIDKLYTVSREYWKDELTLKTRTGKKVTIDR